MPIIKHISVKTGVNKFLAYIENAHKTKERTLITGNNIPTEIKAASDFFKDTYEYYSPDKFRNTEIYTERNDIGHKKNHNKILLHHYVQSFSPDEKITPEEANAIGVEWAKKVFGKDHQFIVSTHVDKEHIHNHFAVCPFSLNGKRWIDNKKTLEYCRNISDNIAKAHGLSIIENPRTRNNSKRKEWEARKSGTSWKKNLCDIIDNIILKPDVLTVNDIKMELEKDGYYVRLGRFMTIKPPDQQRSIRTENLDRTYGGYSMRELEYRINHKNKEISNAAISQMNGIERSYAIYLRRLQITVFKTNGKEDKKKTYRSLVRTADLLTYITINNVRSQNDLKWLRDKRKEAFEEVCNKKRSLEKQLTNLSKRQNTDGNIQIEELKREIEEINICIEEAGNKAREAEQFYEQYMEDYSTDDYSRALEEYRELEETLEDTSLKENEKINDSHENITRADYYSI